MAHGKDPQPLRDLICYEFPLSERMRTFLRLELLFQQVAHFLGGMSAWDSRAALQSLLDVLAILGRSDLKSELIKELERLISVLDPMLDNKAVDRERLSRTLHELSETSSSLYAHRGRLGGPLLENELFKGVAQRGSIPCGACAFDLPAYHFWLEKPHGERRADLARWLDTLAPLRHAVALVLNLIRLSATPTNEVAGDGFHQRSLERGTTTQLVRIHLARGLPYYAEISGGKQRLSVRFMAADVEDRATQTQADVPFQLTCCLL